MFFQFTINSQSKPKKYQHTILETFTDKNQLQNFTRFCGGLFQSETLEVFYQLLQSVLLKIEKKKELLKKDASHLSAPQKIKREKKEKKKEKKKKEKRKVKKSQTTAINISLLLLCIEKLMFQKLQKHILKNLFYIVTFVLQFSRDRLLKMH